tara:strand:- start:227 stop:526 length:300 start_codon:yes stop_codon:yes gene_type:complete
MYDTQGHQTKSLGGQCDCVTHSVLRVAILWGNVKKIQAGVAGTVYLDEVRNLGGAWLKQASRLYENSINTICLADTLAILGYAVDATHIKTADSKAGEN